MSISKEAWNRKFGKMILQQRSLEELRMGLFDAQSKGELLHTIQSDRDSEVFYELMIGKDNVIYCTCQGWMYSQKTPKCCKHLKKFAEDHQRVLHGVFHQREVPSDEAKILIMAFLEYDGKRS